MKNEQKALPPRAVGLRHGRKVLTLLVLFLFLDICTTIVGLSTGLREMNPLLASLMRVMGLNALLVSRLLALALAVYFIYSGRILLLQRATAVMGVVVGWNVLWLFVR